MPIGHQDEGGIPVPMSAELPGRLDEGFDFRRCQRLAGPDIGTPGIAQLSGKRWLVQCYDLGVSAHVCSLLAE